MRQTALIFLLINLLACSTNYKKQVIIKHDFSLPNILAINANFPLILANMNLQDSQNVIHLNDGIESKISQTIYSYYFNECSGDSSETYFKVKDTYLGTLLLQDSLYTLFFILLNHVPDGLTNGKVLFYNNQSKEFIDKIFDFNLFALYDFTNGKLKPSNLKEKFKINSPEIKLLHDNKSEQDNFKFTRLYHNGTTNAIETSILRITNNKIDTLNFKRKWIEN